MRVKSRKCNWLFFLFLIWKLCLSEDYAGNFTRCSIVYLYLYILKYYSRTYTREKLFFRQVEGHIDSSKSVIKLFAPIGVRSLNLTFKFVIKFTVILTHSYFQVP